jgi:hypothetical protein
MLFSLFLPAEVDIKEIYIWWRRVVKTGAGFSFLNIHIMTRMFSRTEWLVRRRDQGEV